LALTHEQKERILAGYGERLARSQVLIWSRFDKVKFSEFERLRTTLRGMNAEGLVVKNTLLRRAIEEAGWQVSEDLSERANLVTFVYGDIAPVAKAVSDFARDKVDRVQIVGGIVGGKVVDSNGIQTLTELPSREVLLARVVGGIQAPITGLVSTLAAVMRGLVNVINAHREQLEGAN
jgi:large subunit ribosomal protein L10